MFRSATTRLAHNSTVPSLAGAAGISKDLKALQDLINAEKSVMQTLQKLSADIAKAGEALKQWGSGEGDDLGDTLTASVAILLHYSSALSRFSNHEGAVREQMKAVRTREEKLDEVKRRRKSLISKADAADKKLSKMNSENKNFQAQADSLSKLREEIRSLDTDILHEEANLGDFKRSTVKYWMGVKFGGLMECCEKGMLVGELGKLVLAEIPMDNTEPGLPRPYYQGHARTEFLVAEAQRTVNEVNFSVEPSQKTTSMSIRHLPGPELPPLPVQLSLYDGSSITSAATPPLSSPTTTENYDLPRTPYSQSFTSHNSTYSALPEIPHQATESLGMQPFLANDSRTSSVSDPFASPRMPEPLNVNMNEFGAYTSPAQFSPRTTSLRNLTVAEQQAVAGPRGPRFATFPVKGAGPVAGSRQQAPISPPPSSFPLPQGLGDRAPSLEIERRDTASFSSSIAQALGEEWTSPGPGPGALEIATKKARDSVGTDQWSPPPPRYSVTPEIPSMPSHAPLPVSQAASEAPQSAISEESDAQLAYDGTEWDSDERGRPLSRASGNASNGRADRHVRFGASDGNEGQAHEQHEEQNRARQSYHDQTSTLQQAEIVPASSPPRTPSNKAPPEPETPVSHLPPSPTSPKPAVPQIASPMPSYPFAGPSNPPPQPQSAEDDEKALNAAAAREVSRELDALMFASPMRHSGTVQDATLPSPPASPPAAQSQSPGMRSADGPTSSRVDLGYVRARDMTGSAPTSPVRSENDHDRAGMMRRSPLAPSSPPPASLNDTFPPHQAPQMNMRSSSSSAAGSAPLSVSVDKSAIDFPLPPPPAFYNLPGASASGTFSPGGSGKISAAAFKRQLRSPSSPQPPQSLSQEVNPLVINKRSAPSSPRIPPPVQSQTQSAGFNPYTPTSYLDPQARPLSGGAGERPYSVAGEDEFDYIAAYVDDYSAPSPNRTSGGYGQGQFATNLEGGHGQR